MALALCGCVWGGAAAAAVSAKGLSEGSSIFAAGVAAQGAPACASCHGGKGEGVEAQGVPRLAHLNEGYLLRQLDAFAAGSRQSAVMGSIAASLDPRRRQLVSAYLASLAAPSFDPTKAPGDVARGKVLAERGDWSVNVPSCASCHGPRGVGVGALSPSLAGQGKSYLFDQLLRFREGTRQSDTIGLMNGVARRLSKADLQAAAAFYASLPLSGPAAARASR